MVRARFFRHLLVCATGTLWLLPLCAAQSQEPSRLRSVTASDYDRYMASQARNVTRHAHPADTPAANAARRVAVSDRRVSARSGGLATAAAAAAPDAGGDRFPADLEYHGGPVVTSMRSHLIYVNLGSSPACSTVASCWGNPRGFLRDLGRSEMIHLVDQYTGSSANGRYTVSEEGISASYPDPNDPKHPYTDNDILAIVHAAVASSEDRATGYDNQYHVFLVPGQDECSDSTFTVCYSPDNPATFFCAYHGSADFADIGHVLYSVEPFMNLFGCRVRPTAPNGQLIDATNNVLSHELIETITDPDGTGWWNSIGLGFGGEEIGDECQFRIYINNQRYGDPSDVTLNGRAYAIQPEYNNAQHACTTTP